MAAKFIPEPIAILTNIFQLASPFYTGNSSIGLAADLHQLGVEEAAQVLLSAAAQGRAAEGELPHAACSCLTRSSISSRVALHLCGALIQRQRHEEALHRAAARATPDAENAGHFCKILLHGIAILEI